MHEFVVAATDTCDESKLSVSEFVPKLDRVGTTKQRCSTNLYVKNFPRDDYTEKELQELFEPFGEIVSVAVMRDDERKCKNFGFVCFK